MFCHKCGLKNDENAEFCVSCGMPLKKKQSSNSRVLLVTLIIISVLVLCIIAFLLSLTIVGRVVGNFFEQPEVAESPSQIELVEEPNPIVMDVNSIQKDKTVVIKESMPKVFTIFTESGLGSGFLYKKGGYIITNAHVVAGYTDVVIRNSNGYDTVGKVIGVSDLYDVALIHSLDYEASEPLQIEMNESAIGAEVIAIGSPQGLENSASIGYLTGIGRNIEFDFSYENVYQVDAQIDQGSSGGPLLDAKTGKVIGINSLLYTNLNSFAFSIPMYSMIDLIDSWVQNPMSETEIAGLFGVYDDYVYEESASEKVDTYYEEYVENQEYEYYFDEYSLENFIKDFRYFYEIALAEEDFYWIQDMLLPNSVAYSELEQYIADISGLGMVFDFTNTTIVDIEIYDEFAVITTVEEFDFWSAAGEYTYYERTKDYTVILDENGFYYITEIYYYD